MLAFALIVAAVIAPESIDQLLTLVDNVVVVEKDDGTTATGTLVSVTPDAVVVRLSGSQRLLEIKTTEIASVATSAPVVAPAPVAAPAPSVEPARPAKRPESAQRERDSEQRQRRRLALARDSVEAAVSAHERVEASAWSWTTGALAGVGIGCAMLGASLFFCGVPLFVGGVVGIIGGSISGVVAAFQWSDASAKQALVNKRRRDLDDAKDEMAY